MPGNLLDVDATVTCIHGGKVQLLSNSSVKVNSKSIVTPNVPYIILGCSLGLSGCKTVTWYPSSGATSIKAGGVPVLLEYSQAKCDPTNTGLIIVSTQQQVKGT